MFSWLWDWVSGPWGYDMAFLSCRGKVTWLSWPWSSWLRQCQATLSTVSLLLVLFSEFLLGCVLLNVEVTKTVRVQKHSDICLPVLNTGVRKNRYTEFFFFGRLPFKAMTIWGTLYLTSGAHLLIPGYLSPLESDLIQVGICVCGSSQQIKCLEVSVHSGILQRDWHLLWGNLSPKLAPFLKEFPIVDTMTLLVPFSLHSLLWL